MFLEREGNLMNNTGKKFFGCTRGVKSVDLEWVDA